MYIEIDISTIPPAVTLRDPDDFTGFKVVTTRPEHSYVEPGTLRQLAGDRAEDSAWLADLDGMLAYAQSKGWVREDGAVRAHLESAD